VHSIDGNTFIREMTSCPPSWKCDVKSKILKNDPAKFAKFHPYPVWNDVALEQEQQDE